MLSALQSDEARFPERSEKKLVLSLTIVNGPYYEGEYIYGNVLLRNNLDSVVKVPSLNTLVGGLVLEVKNGQGEPLSSVGPVFEGSIDSIRLSSGDSVMNQIEMTSSFGMDAGSYGAKRMIKAEDGPYSICTRLGNLKSNSVRLYVTKQPENEKRFYDTLYTVSHRNLRNMGDLRQWRKLIAKNFNSRLLPNLYMQLFSTIIATWNDEQKKGEALRRLCRDYIKRFPNHPFTLTVLDYYQRSYIYPEKKLLAGLDGIKSEFSNKKVSIYAEELINELKAQKK